MGTGTADYKEGSLPGSSSGSNDITADRPLTEDDQQWSGNAENKDDEVEMTQPLQHVRTLGGMRFRPPDDDESQYVRSLSFA